VLDEHDAAPWRTVSLTYPAQMSVDGPTPPGYGRVDVSAALERRDLDAAAADLLAWRVHEWSGLRVHATDVPGRLGSVVLMHVGLGRWALRIPCRVVEVIDEPRRRGFTYGTLPGHPESGAERFVLEQEVDGAIRFTVTAFSRPVTLLARLGGPLTRLAQGWMTRRYLRALDRL
jgi:uncharacterized protein (UPF0548 family)